MTNNMSIVAYRGYLITPGPNSNPTLNDYQAWIIKGSTVIAFVKSYSWMACVQASKLKIDTILPTTLTDSTKADFAEPVVRKVSAMPTKSQVAAQTIIAEHKARWAIPVEAEAAGMPVLNLNETIYNATYKPLGWHLLIIGPTATWRQEWHEWEAIRDIVQNALDESEQYTFGRDASGLWIADKGRGISISDFLLGPAKLKPNYARGKFGEGMKVSALVLTRLGYRVHVRTADKDLWICYFEQAVGSGKTAMTLAALWKESTANTGTLFNIVGYTGDNFAKNFAVNIPKSMILQKSPSSLESPILRFNTIYKATPEFPSTLYCRDIYLNTIRSNYSYNLWGFDLSPDRHGPKNESDVDTDVGRTWACVTDQDMIEYLLGEVTAKHDFNRLSSYESEHVSLSSWYMGSPFNSKDLSYTDILKQNKDVWIRAFKNVCGDNAVLQTDSKYNTITEHLGYKSISLGYNLSALSELLPTDNEVVSKSMKELRKTQIISDEQLNRQQSLNLLLARSIANQISYSNLPIYAALIPVNPNSPGQTLGFYEPILKEIYISLPVLNSGFQTVDTIIHELAHAQSNGASDLSKEHAKAMTEVAARVVRFVSLGKFDIYLKDKDFKWG